MKCGESGMRFLFQRFLQDLLDQQFSVLNPLYSFHRRNFSLSVLHLMASCFRPPPSPPAVPCAVATPPPVFDFVGAISEQQCICLWEGLQDPYDANRTLYLDLLLLLPKERWKEKVRKILLIKIFKFCD